MANELKVHQIIAREAAAILEESSPFISRLLDRSREDDIAKEIGGYKTGQSVKVKVPRSGAVYDGATFAGGGAAADVVEDEVNLTLDIHKHAGVTFTAKEILTDMTNWKERVLRPQISTLAATMEAEMILRAVRATSNVIGTPGTVPSTMKTFSQARAVLNKQLAPADPRYCLMTSDVNTEMVDSSKALFNPNAEVAKMFRTGLFAGMAQGAEFFECQNLPVLTNGNKVASVVVSGGSQVGSSLLVGGLTSGDTFLKGQVFTIAGVFDVHPLTGTPYNTLKQFVVTADTTASAATVSLPIYPSIDISMPGKTVSASPAASAALAFVGAASTAYAQNLMFAPGAFTAAFKSPKVIAGCEGYMFNAGGMALTVQTFGNGTTLTESTRIDVLAGFAAVRGNHGCRIVQ